MKAFPLQCVGLLVCVSVSLLADEPRMRAALLTAEIPLLFRITHHIQGMALRHFGERRRLLISTTGGAVCVALCTLLLLTAFPWMVVGVMYLVAFGVCAVVYCVYFYVRRLFGILLHWPEGNGAGE